MVSTKHSHWSRTNYVPWYITGCQHVNMRNTLRPSVLYLHELRTFRYIIMARNFYKKSILYA